MVERQGIDLFLILYLFFAFALCSLVAGVATGALAVCGLITVAVFVCLKTGGGNNGCSHP